MAKGKQNKGPARDNYKTNGAQAANKEKKAERHKRLTKKFQNRAADVEVQERAKAKRIAKAKKRIEKKGQKFTPDKGMLAV